jgi:hypothetical protein
MAHREFTFSRCNFSLPRSSFNVFFPIQFYSIYQHKGKVALSYMFKWNSTKKSFHSFYSCTFFHVVMMSVPLVYGSATNENRRMEVKKVGKVVWRRTVYHRKGCMSHDIITKYMNWISLHPMQYFWGVHSQKYKRKGNLCWSWHFDIHKKVLLLHHFLVEFDSIFILFSIHPQSNFITQSLDCHSWMLN